MGKKFTKLRPNSCEHAIIAKMRTLGSFNLQETFFSQKRVGNAFEHGTYDVELACDRT